MIERISSQWSRSRELYERLKIVIVGGLECGNVGIASRARSSKIGATPREALAAKLRNQNVGRHTGPAAVSVWKGMYRHEPVVEADSEFVRRI